MKEVEVEQASAWRGGFNRSPQDLETKIINLLQSELESCNVYISKAEVEKLLAKAESEVAA